MRPVQDRVGQCSFWHQRELSQASLPVDQCGCILIASESRPLRRDIVRDDEVEPFRRQFVLCVGDQIIGLRGKANHELRGPLSG